jgi:hypothetical protein
MSKYHYTIKREDTGYGGCEHVIIQLHKRAGAMDDKNLMFGIKWQGSKEFDHWYGVDVEIETGSFYGGVSCKTDHVAEGVALLRKINATATKWPGGFAGDRDPHAYCDLLESMKIGRMVYDDRADGFVKVEDVKAKNYNRWMARRDGNCLSAVIARDEDEARRLLFDKMSSECEEWGRTRFKDWITQGEVVEIDANRRCPDIRTVSEICKPMKANVVPVEVAA